MFAHVSISVLMASALSCWQSKMVMLRSAHSVRVDKDAFETARKKINTVFVRTEKKNDAIKKNRC